MRQEGEKYLDRYTIPLIALGWLALVPVRPRSLASLRRIVKRRPSQTVRTGDAGAGPESPP
jgi:hypothetical protein